MKLDHEELLACPPDEAAVILHEQGKTLRGANLKKSSWLLIANGLHIQRIADILFQRLAAATTREDALRVLRIARKHGRERKKSTGGAHRQAPPENLLAVAAETSLQMYQKDEELIRWELWEDEEFWPRGYYEEWLAEQADVRQARRTRRPGLLPISMLQDAIDLYAWEHRKIERYEREDLRSRLDEETFERLLAMVDQKPGLDLSEAELAFLRENRLDTLLQYIVHPQQPVSADPIRDGIALAGLRIIEDHAGAKGHPFQVDWEAVAGWLAEHLARQPQRKMIPIMISSAYAFFRSAPAACLSHFLQNSPAWHWAWTSLLWYAYPRTAELLKDRAAPGLELPVWWGAGGAYVSDTPWERVLDAGTGSRLVLHNLRNNVEDLFHRSNLMEDRYWPGTRKLLMAGGGTLRRMDYPAFTLVCRPSITLVRLDTFISLTDLSRRLIELERQVADLTRSSLAAWIASTFENLSPTHMHKELSRQIAGDLERHAIAYLMLKERVLREAFQSAPFRLRRRHIQRFWAEHEPGDSPAADPGKLPFSIPAGFEALRAEFGVESLKESLAHALLDHFKDDWGLEEDEAHQIKETLLTLLRSVAITVHLRAPWQPRFGEQPGEEDLEHTQEVANFLIQQTENAPLELAQSLLVEPRQGLPRLAGGRLTELEHSCRRLVREAAGASQKKVTSGEARIFTCRPLSKSAALDRGNLGSDCSSSSVPMRALSPHHTYYGIYENGEQQRGYITVYEAWAEFPKTENEAKSERLPALCLETINVPMRVFDAVQQDLLLIFEAVAKSRGLAGGLILITGLGTWNYQNGEVLRQSRRARQGRPAHLLPADPAGWNVYTLLAPEAGRYTAFLDDPGVWQNQGLFRALAPFQPDQDLVEPENLSEAQRIANLAPRKLQLIARDERGPAGFISEMPEIL